MYLGQEGTRPVPREQGPEPLTPARAAAVPRTSCECTASEHPEAAQRVAVGFQGPAPTRGLTAMGHPFCRRPEVSFEAKTVQRSAQGAGLDEGPAYCEKAISAPSSR